MEHKGVSDLHSGAPLLLRWVHGPRSNGDGERVNIPPLDGKNRTIDQASMAFPMSYTMEGVTFVMGKPLGAGPRPLRG